MKIGRDKLEKIVCCSLLSSILIAGAGCAIAGPMADELNPYGSGGGGVEQGVRDSSTIVGASGGGAGEAERARHQLEALGAYRRALSPQPAYPVVRPAEVRLMWIPDHLNKVGDLVPAHYYYLRVTNDQFEVQDAFDYDNQLNNQPGLTYIQPAAGAVAPAAGAPAVTGVPASASGQSFGTGTSGSSTPWVYKATK
jgi:hypothetical protein